MTARGRSTGYPFCSLEEVVLLAEKVRDGLGSGDVTREQISQVIGHNKLTGHASRKIAAIAHYGLLDKGKSCYCINSLATRILSPISDQEKSEALREAALKPTLFLSIYEKYLPDGKLPNAIEAIMQREFGVTREASKLAHNNLVQSLVYAGLLDETTLCFTQCGQDGEEVTRDESKHKPLRKEAKDEPNIPVQPGYQVYELPMAFGTAKVMLPPKLTQKDFDTLESLVRLIEHFVFVELVDNNSDNPEENE